MENAVEALKMAGSVLIFVIALSVAILALTQAREGIDAVLKYSDRESSRIDNDERFYYVSSDDNKNRIVGLETIIPTIYRAYKENFKIVFNFGDEFYLYKDKNSNKINKIDMSLTNVSNDNDSREFLEGIVYGKYNSVVTNENGNKLTGETAFKYKFNFVDDIPTGGVVEYINKNNNSKIIEQLGTYYMEDIGESSEGLDDANKTKKRVITYSFVE